jgi:hypothetical protein
MGVSVTFDQSVLKMVESEVRTIKAEYRGVVSEESIDSLADESLQRLADSRVPQFVPLFVGRFTRDLIKQLVNSPQGAPTVAEQIGAKTTPAPR